VVGAHKILNYLETDGCDFFFRLNFDFMFFAKLSVGLRRLIKRSFVAIVEDKLKSSKESFFTSFYHGLIDNLYKLWWFLYLVKLFEVRELLL